MKRLAMIEFQGGGGSPSSLEVKGIAYSKKRSAFSVAELLIVLFIIGVLAVVLIPIIKNIKPDEKEAMHKKATYIVERVVNELSSDDYLYPSNNDYKGFKNVSLVNFHGKTHSGETKFCTLFAASLNLKPGTDVNCVAGEKSATSIEGIDWFLPIGYFDEDKAVIKADVNGDAPPNCEYNSVTCKNPDIFVYTIGTGTKITTPSLPVYEDTAPPPGDPGMPAPPSTTDKERPGLIHHSISCGNVDGATILGQGGNKTDGNYTLVAIPKKGYACSWLVHQVTVKGANVTDCNISCWPDSNLPVADGGETPVPPVEPPVDPPNGDDDDGGGNDKTFCINIKMLGSQDGCTVSGSGCGKENGKEYTVTVTTKDEKSYKASWTSKKYLIANENIEDQVTCEQVEDEKCYNLDANVTGLCTVEGTGCKKPGTYTITITPKEGYSYNNSTNVVNQNVVIVDKDVTVDVLCKAPAPKEEDMDPCCAKNFGTGAKYIAKSNACVRDLGRWDSESVNCKNNKTYCKGILSNWQYPSQYASAYKSCLNIKMDIPSKAKFLELYNNRQSVFPDSNWYTNPRQSGYYTNEGTLSLPGHEGLPEHLVVHIPYDNQDHHLAVRNPGARALCWATAPAECKSDSNSDVGTDDISINVVVTSQVGQTHKSSLDYKVTWTVDKPPLKQGKKYKVIAQNWVVGTPMYTYYGVTSTTSGSQTGTITGIPSWTPSNQVKVTVSFY